jgi:uncharacterized protein YndB with AHSA1/START domain
MATLSINPVSHRGADNDAVTCELFIAAPRERVFEALTDPAQASQWWGAKSVCKMDNFSMDVRTGGKWSTTGLSAANGPIEVHGEFLEIDPPRRLSYTWTSSWLQKITKVLWELENLNGGTFLKLTHTGFAGDAAAIENHTHGWNLVLASLQAYAERGETIASRH